MNLAAVAKELSGDLLTVEACTWFDRPALAIRATGKSTTRMTDGVIYTVGTGPVGTADLVAGLRFAARDLLSDVECEYLDVALLEAGF